MSGVEGSGGGKEARARRPGLREERRGRARVAEWGEQASHAGDCVGEEGSWGVGGGEVCV